MNDYNADWWAYLANDRKGWALMLEVLPPQKVIELLRAGEARARENAESWRTNAEQEPQT